MTTTLTKGELAYRYEDTYGGRIDMAVPQDWLDIAWSLLPESEHEALRMVGWHYRDSDIFGRPVGLTHEAQRALAGLASCIRRS